MKTKLLLLLLLLMGVNAFAQYTSIPDTNFEAKLIALKIDDVADGKVLTSNINTVKVLDLYNCSIADLTGIQDFTALTNFTCQENKLTSIDVSKNTALTSFSCSYNTITSLDVSKNTALTNLNFNNNKISSIDISKNTSLTSIYCSSNQLTSLDVSKNTALKYLDCGRNSLTNLNLKNGKNTLFSTLTFSSNDNLMCIAVDDVAYANTNWANKKNTTAFYSPYDCNSISKVPDSAFENKLIALGIDTDGKNGVVLNSTIANVTTLDVSNSSISDLTGIEGFKSLTTLNVSNNLLSRVDLSQNSSFKTLNCSNNPTLTCIQVTDIAYATNNWTTTKDANANFSLDCRPYTLIPDPKFEARLIALKYDDVADGKVLTSKINTITFLATQGFSITDLTGIQDFVKLRTLYCQGNKLTSLDVSKNTELNTFDCSNNNLSNLDVSKNTALMTFDCYTNNLSNLDVSKNTSLTKFDCSANNLASLNLKNGKNTLFTTLNLSKNYSLSCITVDDVAYANTNWADKKNANALFTSYECSTVTQIPDAQFESKLIALGIDTDGKNGIVLNSSIAAVKTLDIPNSSITDLTGIQAFKELTSLNVSKNSLTSIDLSQNSNLKTLNCSANASLTCIQVADIAYATNNWTTTKDALANFNLDCRAYTLIPDAKFEAKLILLKFDDIADGKVLTSKINNVTNLNLYASGIKDLTGIQDFKALTQLECSYNHDLSSLDLSKNKKLTSLVCNSTALTSLDLSENTALAYLSFNMTKIKSIDVSKNILLTHFEGYRNQLNNLDVSKNTALSYLQVYENYIPSLDVSKNTALTYLNCSSNPLTKVNLKNGNNTLLTLDFTFNETLSCLIVDDVAYANSKWITNQQYTPLISPYDCSLVTPAHTLFEDKLIALGIDTDGKNGIVLNSSIDKVTALDVSNSSLTDLSGLTGFTALKTLNVSGNLITSIDLSQNKALTTLDSSNNPALSCIQVADIAYATSNWTVKKDALANYSLDCRAYTLIPDTKFEAQLIALKIDDVADGKVLTSKINKLKSLSVTYDNITDLTGIQDFTNLTSLYCNDNNLTSLDLSKNTALTYLNCKWNKLTNLNISKNTALTTIECSVNQLTSLDVSQNTAVTSLNFSNNKVTSIDVSKNTALSSLRCTANQLKTLDISKNIALRTLYVNANKLSSLNLKNGKNTLLSTLDFTENPTLSCIAVDDLAYANTNWISKKEANAYFTIYDCSATTTLPNALFEDKLIALGIDTDGKNGYVVNASINTLTTLDISNSSLTDLKGLEGFTALKTLNVSNNLLTDLDLSKNTALTTLNSSKNTALTCIQVADIAIANKWTTTKDATANFSLDCRKYTTIPDTKFEAKLIALEVDDIADGKVLTSNINTLKDLIVNESFISDLTGIQDFTELTRLECHSNQITKLDVSKNTKLNYLSCQNNQITVFDVSKNTQLETLQIYNNVLTKLDVNTTLKDLNCQNNQLTNLDFSKNTGLTQLYCRDNNLTSLNLKNGNNTLLSSRSFASNPNLSCILVDDAVYANTNWRSSKDKTATYSSYDCSTVTGIPDALFEDKLIALGIDTDGKNGLIFNSSIQKLTTLDVSNSAITDLTGIQGFTALTNLVCSSNQLSTLNISKNVTLTSVDCSKNTISKIDISGNTALTSLICSSNKISTLDISGNTALIKLDASSNRIYSFDAEKNTALTHLILNSNQLNSLDLSKNVALTQLILNSNQLYSLDLSKNTQLTDLNLSSNSFSEINVDKNTQLISLIVKSNNLYNLNVINNTALTVLDFSDNRIAIIDLTKNKGLTQLLCNSNRLTSLYLSEHKALTDLNCSSNYLQSLNLKNGNNTRFNSATIHLENNSNLSCIKVDNKTYSDTNWATIKDATASYDEICELSLPSDNFSIQTKGELCVGENNGEISIYASKTYNYVATVNDQSKNFTDNSLNLYGLAPGNYKISIAVPGETFEQTFNLTIPKATATTGKSSVSSENLNVEITTGTAPYTVFVDGIEQFQTNTSSFSVTAKKSHLLEVKTAKACEGIYTEDITGLDLVVSAYPNPTSGSFEIQLPISDKEVTIEINALDGRLISSKKYNSENGIAQLTLENQPNGVYLATIHLNTVKVIKIIKK